MLREVKVQIARWHLDHHGNPIIPEQYCKHNYLNKYGMMFVNIHVGQSFVLAIGFNEYSLLLSPKKLVFQCSPY